MSITVDASFTSGSYGSKATSSCVGIAGAGLPSAFFYAEGELAIERRDDGSIWVNCMGFSCKQSGMSNANTDGTWGDDDWTFQGLYCSRSDFDVNITSSGISTAGYAVTGTAHMTHEGYTGAGTTGGSPISHVVASDAVSSKGWVRVASSINEVEHTADGETLYLYFAGGITFSQAVTSSITINAVRIPFTGQEVPQLFDYVPCAVRSGASWLSCNREGGKLQLKVGGGWRDCKNSYGDGESDVLIRKGGSWVKAEKVGEE